MEITKINTMAKLPAKKRVCAYCRVSVEKEMMLHSLSYQVSYYSKLIQKTPGWTYAGVYSDEGLTGTKTSRPGFQKMLADARKGSIDLILVKSVSRFARNTVDLLNTCRELKELNIDVFFEEQNIHSLSYEGELMLTLQASFAQEESRSMSENIKWKIRKDFQEGKPARNRALGYEIKNRTVRIIPAEAKVVQLIFRLYLSGYGELMIARYLNENGYRTWNGKMYRPNSIKPIISNNTYTGDLLLQKTFRKDCISKKKTKNKGELPQYLIRGNHQAIISKEDFEKAQDILNKKIKRYNICVEPRPVYPFSYMIVCGDCGAAYRRRKCNGKVYYHCKNKINKMHIECHAQQIPEEELYRMTKEVFKLKEFDETLFKQEIDHIIARENRQVEFVFKAGHSIIKEWNFKSRKHSWTDEMKAKAKINGAKAHKKGEDNGSSRGNTTKD